MNSCNGRAPVPMVDCKALSLMAPSNQEDPIHIGALARAAAGTPTDPAEAADAAGGPEAATRVEGTANAAASATMDQIHGVADALAAGTMSAEQAQRALIEQALAAQLPVDADPAIVAQLRIEVEALLAGDPTLADLLRP